MDIDYENVERKEGNKNFERIEKRRTTRRDF